MTKNIFLSRPNRYNPVYTSTVKRLTEELRKRSLNPITIGSTVFPNEYPISAIRKEMQACSGIIILGIPQMLVRNGISKPKTKFEKEVNNKLYPSVWNQIEGAMAFMLNLPTMLISEKDLHNEGLFEIGTLPITKHEYNLKSADWMNSSEFLDPFNEWIGLL